MAAINFVAWAPGVWADDVWALGVWEGEVAGAQNTIGGGVSQAGGDKYRDPLVDQVLDKWAFIEQARERDEPPGTLIDEGTIIQAEAAQVIEDMPQAYYAGPPLRLDLPGTMLAKPLPKGPKPLLPSAEQMVRDAIERDDEEALILILSQL